jgi:hypothetical protein
MYLPVHVLRINIVLVQECGQLFALRLRQPDAERTVRIEDDLAKDEMRGLGPRDLLCWREHLLPEMLRHAGQPIGIQRSMH